MKTRRDRKSDLLQNPTIQVRAKESRILGKVKKEEYPKPDPEEREIEVPADLKSQYSRCISVLDRVNQQLIKIQTVSGEVRKTAQKVQGGLSKIVADDNFCFLSVSYDYLNVVPGLLRQKSRKSLPQIPSHYFRRVALSCLGSARLRKDIILSVANPSCHRAVLCGLGSAFADLCPCPQTCVLPAPRI